MHKVILSLGALIMLMGAASSVTAQETNAPANSSGTTSNTTDTNATSGDSSATTPTASPTEVVTKDDAVTKIACEYDGDESFARIRMSSKPTKGTYHYKVYLPPGYSQDPSKQFPCLFIMSPDGNAGFDNVQDKLRSLGWIGIALVEAKNGQWEPIMGNFLAAHDDAVKRFRIQEGMKVATGFSGGARASSMFVGMRDGFRGLILQGAAFRFDDNGFVMNSLPSNAYVFMTMGDSDSNKKEVAQLTSKIPASRFKVETFTGGHQWAPKELMAEGLDWIISQWSSNSDDSN